MNIFLKIAKWQIITIILVAAGTYCRPALAQPIRVVATFPDLADITRQIGKNLVSVESLATGVEDPHGVPMKPSFVPRLNRANVLVVTG
ncbi:MAG TPA: zinc ABC transporter substrate-binding protein, partial [Candidatus Eisenbacteria bacterium]|nr:zinc ABC transporter substrate-binding protein [Candidatus Eisenbacteria bacterium]